MKEEILLPKLKQQSGQLGLKDLQLNSYPTSPLGGIGALYPPSGAGYVIGPQRGTQPSELRPDPATLGFRKLENPSKLPSDQI